MYQFNERKRENPMDVVDMFKIRKNHMHLNSKDVLPPTNITLLILVNDVIIKAIRPSLAKRKEDCLEYLTESGETIFGRYKWTYP